MAQNAVEATVSDAHPHQNSRVTVTGDIAGKDPSRHARMVTTWHFKSRNSKCQSDADEYGTAKCSRDIGRATRGYTVFIDVDYVDVDTGHILDEAKVSFTPQ